MFSGSQQWEGQKYGAWQENGMRKDFHEAGKAKKKSESPSQGAAALPELSYREDDLQQAAVLVLSQS